MPMVSIAKLNTFFSIITQILQLNNVVVFKFAAKLLY